jgi:ubiquinone/menaquinone biosynthesis C-methylase UbiE
MIRAASLYTFLGHCDDSPLEKEVLDCGAGVYQGYEPPLYRFFERGYQTHGIELSAERVAAARQFCRERGVDLDVRQGDMCQLPFQDASISFVYSWNTIFHMPKADIAVAMGEMERVLKPGGLCFVNFLSVSDPNFEKDASQATDEGHARHIYHQDDEPDLYFVNFEMLRKEKRTLQRWIEGEMYPRAYLDYIARKK